MGVRVCACELGGGGGGAVQQMHFCRRGVRSVCPTDPCVGQLLPVPPTACQDTHTHTHTLSLSHTHTPTHTSNAQTHRRPLVVPPPPPILDSTQPVPAMSQVLNSPLNCNGFAQPRTYIEAQAWFTP
jgi:hypothetical protein